MFSEVGAGPVLESPGKLNLFSDLSYEEVYEALADFWPERPQQKFSPWTQKFSDGVISYAWFRFRGGVDDYKFAKNTLPAVDAPPLLKNIRERLSEYVDAFNFDAVLANHCTEEAVLGEHCDNEKNHVPGDIVSVSFTKDPLYERRFFYRADGVKVNVPLVNGDVFRGRLDLLPHGLNPPLKRKRSASIVLTFRRVR